MDSCHFFFIHYLSPAPGRKEMGEIQSCLFGSRGVFIWFIPCLFSFPFLCLQLEQSFRWERFPNLCCEAVKPQGRCRFLWESALLISGDAKAPLNGISSARTLLANLLQGIPKEKGEKKTSKKRPQVLTQLLASHRTCAALYLFVSCFCFSRGIQRP